jgi:hypothetical protein
MKAQNFIFLGGENFEGLLVLTIRGARMRIDMARAITPPNFDGIDRRTT